MSQVSIDNLERVTKLSLNIANRDYCWQNGEEYEKTFGREVFGGPNSNIVNLLKYVRALECAVDYAIAALGRLEPNDSRAVSDEFVSLLCIRSQVEEMPEAVKILKQSTKHIESLPEPSEVIVEIT